MSRPRVLVTSSRGLGWPDPRELWRYRELILALAARDIQVRYKRAAIGVAWALVQPLLTLVVFTLIFSRLANVPTEGVPYPVFAMAALLPWQFFQRSLTQASGSLVVMQGMLTKIYFPRLVAPLAEIAACLPDFAISLMLLFGVMAWYGAVPTVWIVTIPLLTLLVLVTAFAMSLWLSAISIEFRDVQIALPFLVQLWMFATPVAYPLSVVPLDWQWLMALNPMTIVVESFRCVLLGKTWVLSTGSTVISVLSMVALLIGGLLYFEKVQRTFADRI
jgi:lipopolysaccharide transport system permease protein